MSIINELKRSDLAAMAEWIEPGSRVLDLGCGDGELLEHLKLKKGCWVQGVDIDEANLLACLGRGIPVIQRDLNQALDGFPEQGYDYIILSQTIHQVKHPERLVREMLRIGRLGIVSFPNFGYWRLRLSLLVGGRMPKNDLLPFEWYETPNIHTLTDADFEDFCRNEKLKILKRFYLAGDRYHEDLLFPNWSSEGSVALIGK
jgi:methionine biosynthesis protein MetW